MQVYVGQTSSLSLIPRLVALGFGEVVQPYEQLPPKRDPWFYDNAAFADFQAGRPFDGQRFLRGIETFQALRLTPAFVVLPDVVGGGTASLELSLSWLPQLQGVGPLYLVAQDGMTPHDMEPHLEKVQGVFVGGSLSWKLRTAPQWIALARKHHLPCHIGRVGTRNRVAWALRLGADSFDSCVPLFSETNLQRFLKGFDTSQQGLECLTEVNSAWPVPERKPLHITRRVTTLAQGELF